MHEQMLDFTKFLRELLHVLLHHGIVYCPYSGMSEALV